MFGRRMVRCVLLYSFVFAAAAYSGCILSPKEEPPIVEPPAVWKDLTHKEDVIYNLLQCYKVHDITHFEELLHPQYLWYNQLTDVQSGYEEYYQRDEEIRRTRGMFLAADQRYPDPKLFIDKLELTIFDGSWQKVSDFNGEPCDDCWETTREYTITVVMVEGSSTLVGNDLVKFTVVPVDVNGTKYYRFGRADDIKKP